MNVHEPRIPGKLFKNIQILTCTYNIQQCVSVHFIQEHQTQNEVALQICLEKGKILKFQESQH